MSHFKYIFVIYLIVWVVRCDSFFTIENHPSTKFHRRSTSGNNYLCEYSIKMTFRFLITRFAESYTWNDTQPSFCPSACAQFSLKFPLQILVIKFYVHLKGHYLWIVTEASIWWELQRPKSNWKSPKMAQI